MAGNAGIQIIGKAGTTLVAMIALALLTRHLGPAAFGRYSLVLNIVAIAGTVAELGVGTIAVRELASGRRAAVSLLPAVLVLRLALGLAAVLAAVALGAIVGYDETLLQLIALGATALVVRGAGQGTWGLLSTATLRSYRNVAGDAVETVLFLAVVALGVGGHHSLGWFVAAAPAAALANGAVIAWFNRHDAPRGWRLDPRLCLELLREALPLAVAGMLGVVYFRLDPLLLARLVGDGATGLFGVAFRFVESCSTIGTILLGSLFPVLSYFFERDRVRFAMYYHRALELMASLGASAAIALYLFAVELTSVVAGTAFSGSADVLRIACPAIVLMFVNNVGAHLLFASRRQSRLIAINLAAVAAKLVAGLALIPSFGARGAAIAMVATELVVAVPLFLAVRRSEGFASPIGPLLKLLPIAAAIVCFVEFNPPPLWERALALIAWAGALLLLGMPRPSHLRLLLQRSGT